MKELLRIDEVQKLLPYSRSKIYELIKEGKLEAVCPTGRRGKFVTRRSLERYIENIIKKS